MINRTFFIALSTLAEQKYVDETSKWAKEHDTYIMEYEPEKEELLYEVDMSQDEILAKYGENFIRFVDKSELYIFEYGISFMKPLKCVKIDKENEIRFSDTITPYSDDIPEDELTLEVFFNRDFIKCAELHDCNSVELTKQYIYLEEIKARIAATDKYTPSYEVVLDCADERYALKHKETGLYYRDTYNGENFLVKKPENARAFTSIRYSPTVDELKQVIDISKFELIRYKIKSVIEIGDISPQEKEIYNRNVSGLATPPNFIFPSSSSSFVDWRAFTRNNTNISNDQ